MADYEVARIGVDVEKHLNSWVLAVCQQDYDNNLFTREQTIERLLRETALPELVEYLNFPA